MYQRIRDLREDQDLSQKDIGAYLHIHQTTYSDYELGELNISIPMLIKLAEFYNTSVDYLLDLTDERRPYPRKKQKL